MPTASTATRTSPLGELSREELRRQRHALANQIQPLQSRLWMIDDELERRDREQASSAHSADGRQVVGVEGVDGPYQAPVLEVMS